MSGDPFIEVCGVTGRRHVVCGVEPGNRQVLNPRRTSSKKEGVRRSGSRPHGTLRHRKPENRD